MSRRPNPNRFGTEAVTIVPTEVRDRRECCDAERPLLESLFHHSSTDRAIDLAVPVVAHRSVAARTIGASI